LQLTTPPVELVEVELVETVEAVVAGAPPVPLEEVGLPALPDEPPLEPSACSAMLAESVQASGKKKAAARNEARRGTGRSGMSTPPSPA
jgi:hypothetical protein